MRIQWMRAVAVVFVVAVLVAGCGGNSTTSASAVASVAVSGSSPSIGTTSQFRATATFMDGHTQDVTSSSTWTSSNAAVASVSSAGVVGAIAAGTSLVQATYLGVSGSSQISIVAP